MQSPSGAQAAELSPGLVGYAVLRANFNYSAQSYIENFSSFVLDVLAQAQPQYLREAEVAECVRRTFGLTIPDRVVGALLKRGIARGVVQSLQDRFCLADGAATGVKDLNSEIAKFDRQQKELLAKFADFVVRESPEHADQFTTAGLARHLQEFIERNAVPLLATTLRPGATGPWGNRSEHSAHAFLVSAFLQHLYENDGTAFGYVVDSVKGAMLASVLELDTGNMSQRLGKVHLLLDTPVVLKLLGYQGEIQQRAAKQMVDLALRLDAKVACFEHTEQEVDGVLEAAQAALGSRGRKQGKLREVDAYFLESGLGPADIEVFRGRLTSDLQRYRVSVISKPDSYYQYGLDESKLEALLQDDLPTQSELTRRFDVDSLSSIHRLRKGSSPNDFLRCSYVLITSNEQIARTSRKVSERHGWPLAMTDSELATILWVRSPAVAEDLPRQQLIATAYAGLQPSSHLWSRYLNEVETLQRSGGVSEEDALILRARPEARRALMGATLGQDEQLTSEVVLSVVDRIRGDIAAPYEQQTANALAERDEAAADARKREGALQASEALRAQESERLSSLASQLEHTQAELEEIRVQEGQRDARIRSNAQRIAHRIMLALSILVAGVLCAAAGIDFARPRWAQHLPTWLGIVLLLGGVALAFITALSRVIGGSVLQWFAPLERWQASRIELRNRRRSGLKELR